MGHFGGDLAGRSLRRGASTRVLSWLARHRKWTGAESRSKGALLNDTLSLAWSVSLC